MRTVALVIDLLAKQRHAEAADVLAQRLKALERSVVDGAWVQSQFLELIPPEGATLLDKDEDLMLAKEARAEAELRTGSSWWGAQQWHQPGKGGAPKGDRKGKGKKGKGKEKGFEE